MHKSLLLQPRFVCAFAVRVCETAPSADPQCFRLWAGLTTGLERRAPGLCIRSTIWASACIVGTRVLQHQHVKEGSGICFVVLAFACGHSNVTSPKAPETIHVIGCYYNRIIHPRSRFTAGVPLRFVAAAVFTVTLSLLTSIAAFCC